MFIFFLLGLFLSSWQAAAAQIPQTPQAPATDPFESVPPEARDDVRKSTELIVNLYKQRQWSRIYDLMGEASTTREKFIRNGSQTWTLFEFSPTRVKELNEENANWLVNGCATVYDHGERRQWESFIEMDLKHVPKRIHFHTVLKKRGGLMPCLHPTKGNDPAE